MYLILSSFTPKLKFELSYPLSLNRQLPVTLVRQHMSQVQQLSDVRCEAHIGHLLQELKIPYSKYVIYNISTIYLVFQKYFKTCSCSEVCQLCYMFIHA